VCRFNAPPADKKIILPLLIHTIDIELFYDGNIVDLNAFPLPADYTIIDERFSRTGRKNVLRRGGANGGRGHIVPYKAQSGREQGKSARGDMLISLGILLKVIANFISFVQRFYSEQSRNPH